MPLYSLKLNDEGNALTEFALLAPVFFLITFGLITFSRVYWTISSLDFALGQGARYAMLHVLAPPADAIREAKAHLYGMDANAVTFLTSSFSINGVSYLTLRAKMPYTLLPYVVPPITLDRHLQMPILP